MPHGHFEERKKQKMTIRERLAGLLRMSQGGEDEEGEEDEGDPAPQAAGHRAGLWDSTGNPS